MNKRQRRFADAQRKAQERDQRIADYIAMRKAGWTIGAPNAQKVKS